MAIQENEMRYLVEKLGTLSLKKIAENMGKNVETLEIVLHRLTGNSNTKSYTGMITAGELAKFFKIDRNTVVGWMNRHALPFYKRVTNSKRQFTFIDIEEFWDWAASHKSKIDFSKLEMHSLPPEPEWVAQERKKAKKSVSYKPWTIKEEKHLMELVEQGQTFNEISKVLNRTVASVEKKYSRLI